MSVITDGETWEVRSKSTPAVTAYRHRCHARNNRLHSATSGPKTPQGTFELHCNINITKVSQFLFLHHIIDTANSSYAALMLWFEGPAQVVSYGCAPFGRATLPFVTKQQDRGNPVKQSAGGIRGSGYDIESLTADNRTATCSRDTVVNLNVIFWQCFIFTVWIQPQ